MRPSSLPVCCGKQSRWLPWLAVLLLVSCKQEEVPFPYVPNIPTDFNLSTTFADEMKGPVAMFTSETFDEFHNAIVSQQIASFDTAGRCLNLYYRNAETCQRLSFTYDSLGRRVEEHTFVDTTGTSFDNINMPYTHTTYSYSRKGRRCKARITGPDGKQYTFRLHFDKNKSSAHPQGRLTRFIYPDGSRFSYDYDTAGHLVRLTWPDASFERYEYNSDGEMKSKIDRNGVYTWYIARPPASRVDSLGRVVEEVVGKASSNSSALIIATYEYDNHNNWVRRTTASLQTPTRIEVRSFSYYNVE